MTDTPDDAAERTKQLAKKLLEVLDAPTDPEKEARLAEKEAKFIPPRTQLIPDTRLTPDERDDRKACRERYSRGWLTSERDRLLALATQTGGR